MHRLRTAALLLLVLTSIALTSTSCKQTSATEIRIINAMPDSTPVDIYFNNSQITASLPFTGIMPPAATPARYESVVSGVVQVDGFPPGERTNATSPVGTLTLNGQTTYTILAVGLQGSQSPPLAVVDNNTPPTAGTLEYRIINASLNTPPHGLDVYFVPPGTDLTDYAPQINGLGYEQSTIYPVPPLASGYSVIVTDVGKKTPIITLSSTAGAGSITTIVIIDNVGGTNGISPTPLVLNDLE